MSSVRLFIGIDIDTQQFDQRLNVEASKCEHKHHAQSSSNPPLQHLPLPVTTHPYLTLIISHPQYNTPSSPHLTNPKTSLYTLQSQTPFPSLSLTLSHHPRLPSQVPSL